MLHIPQGVKNHSVLDTFCVIQFLQHQIVSHKPMSLFTFLKDNTEPASPWVSLRFVACGFAALFATAVRLSNSRVSAHTENSLSNNGPAEGRRTAPSAASRGSLVAPQFPMPRRLCGSFPATRSAHTAAAASAPHPRGERRGGRRAAGGVGRGSQGNAMNLFSEKHGVQTGRFLLSCFSSVKASINSTLIIKSEQ